MIQLKRAMFPFSIGKEKQLGPAFNGCSTVSAFPGKGKKTAWQVCEIFDDATDAFARLSETPAAIGDPYM
jgi:hypothetical protein